MRTALATDRLMVAQGDCRDVLAALARQGVQVEAVVTDPPYHLTSVVKRFGSPTAAPARSDGPTGVYGRASRGFMGKTWDGGNVAFQPETWAKVAAVMKPGAWMMAFGGTRTYHRMVCAIEDAGLEVRDQFLWLYGQGFPKSRDVARDIDRLQGHERPVVGEIEGPGYAAANVEQGAQGRTKTRFALRSSEPIGADAMAWNGWGTAVKPAHEPIVLARKPVQGSVAENLLAHGTGALNIRGCRVDGEPLGRHPANVIHDGSDAIEAALGDKARFFYAAKAGPADRAGSKHPTVKPVALLRHLVRLVTPPGGVVLDPFAGSGTTAAAALAEGFNAVLIEREDEYVADIVRRFQREAA